MDEECTSKWRKRAQGNKEGRWVMWSKERKMGKKSEETEREGRRKDKRKREWKEGGGMRDMGASL